MFDQITVGNITRRIVKPLNRSKLSTFTNKFYPDPYIVQVYMNHYGHWQNYLGFNTKEEALKWIEGWCNISVEQIKILELEDIYYQKSMFRKLIEKFPFAIEIQEESKD